MIICHVTLTALIETLHAAVFTVSFNFVKLSQISKASFLHLEISFHGTAAPPSASILQETRCQDLKHNTLEHEIKVSVNHFFYVGS